MEGNQRSRPSWMSWLVGGFLGLLMPGASLADDGPVVCIDLQTSSTPDPSTITATYTGSGPTVYAFLVVTEIPGDYVSAISAGFELTTDGSVTNTGFTILEDWQESSAAAYGFDPHPTGSGELVPVAIGYWTLELSAGISSTATLTLVPPGDGNGDVVLAVDGERRGFAAAEVKHGGINASAPTTSTNDPLREYLSTRKHHVLLQSLGENLVMPEGLIGAPLETFTHIDSTLRAAFLTYEPVRIDMVFPTANAETDSILVMSVGFHLRMPELWRCFKATMADTTDVDSLIADLIGTHKARYAGRNEIADVSLEPDDTGYPAQWHLENDGTTVDCPDDTPPTDIPCIEDVDIDAASAWNLSTGDEAVIVAIIDSGIRRDHQDLQDRNIIGDTHYDCYPPNAGHGTWVTGVLAATTDNGLGIAGVDWECTILAKCTNFDHEVVARQVKEATDEGANVLNMSLAYNGHTPLKPEMLRQALLDASYRGVLPVASAGNFGTPVQRYPAAYPNVIGVGNIDCCNGVHSSSHDGWLSVMAPGHKILTTNFGPLGYVRQSGTSFACPVVSGITSMMLTLDRELMELRDIDARRIIELTSVDLGITGYDNLYAWGRVNAAAALEYVSSNLILNELTIPEGQASEYGSPSDWIEIQWDFPPSPYPPGEYLSRRQEVRTEEVDFPLEFAATPDVWVRLAGTVGLDDANYQEYDFPWGEAVDVSTTGCVLRTYVYEVETLAGTTWWPAPPEDVRFAYTAAGQVPDPSSVETAGSSVEHLDVRVARIARGSSEVELMLQASKSGKGRLAVYDVSGRLTRVLFEGPFSQQTHAVTWDTRATDGMQVPSGVYFATWEIEGVGTARTRIVLVR